MPPLKVAVNLRTLYPGKIGGLETAFREVAARLLHRAERDVALTLVTSPWNHDSFDAWLPGGLARRVLMPAQDFEAPLMAAVSGHDVLWCPLFFLEPLRAAVPSVVMIPDLQHDRFPEFFTPEVLALRLRLCRAGTALSSRVLTLSGFSRRHILDTYDIPPAHVIATPLDAGDEFKRPPSAERQAAVRARYLLPERYLLFPANSWPHKNHRGLFQALAVYRDRFGKPPTLVLSGARVGVDLTALAREAGVTDLVQDIGFASSDDMPDLYDGAAALVFPSLFEGFGIPVVEAFLRGVPVAAADATSLPEIAGDAALLFDPHDPAAMAAAIHDVLTGGEAARARIARGRERAATFSYDRAAEITLTALREAATQPASVSITRDARPRVFVVTPSYNQGRFLRATIDSVLSQDYERLEYFVADGGSTDDSVEILKSYGDRVRWVSGPDGGQAAAIAKAWGSSDADVLAWLNSDDTYLPGAVKTAVAFLGERPELSMVYGNAWYTDVAGEVTGPYPTRPWNREALAGECFICQPTAFVRREVFRVIGLPDASLRTCMDYDLWIRLSLRFEVGHVDAYLATSRMYAENKTLGERAKVFEEIAQVCRRHYGSVHPSWILGEAAYRSRFTAAAIEHLPRRMRDWYIRRLLARAVH